MNVCSVEKVSPRAPTSSHTREFTRERSLTSVLNAKRVSAGAQLLLNIREFTLTESCNYDRNNSFEGTILFDIKELF